MGVPRASWVLIILSAQQYGLYSAFMGCFVYFFLGTSRDVTLGPTAIMSLLVSFYTFREPAYAVLLAFLSGCIQLGMGFLRLGKTLRLSCQGCGSALLGVLSHFLLAMPCLQHFLFCIPRALPVCLCQEGWHSAFPSCAQRPGRVEKCPWPQSLGSLSCSPGQPKQGMPSTSPQPQSHPHPLSQPILTHWGWDQFALSSWLSRVPAGLHLLSRH